VSKKSVSAPMGLKVQVASGDGVAARYGGSLVLAPADSPLLDAVLELAAQAEREHPEAPGRFLPRKVAGLVSQSDDAMNLGIVSTLEDGLAVLLVGDVTLTLVDDGGTTTQSGRDATTWVDRIVRGPWKSLSIALPGAGAVNRRSDLQGGVVDAGGLELTPADAPVAAPAAAAPAPAAPVDAAPAEAPPPAAAEPEPPTMTDLEVPAITPQEAPAFQSFALDEPAEAEPLPAAEPLPVAGVEPAASEPMSDARSTAPMTSPAEEPAMAAAAEEPASGEVIVQGIECSRQHFNDPTSIYCAVCGISMVHQTHNLVSGPRPPLGVIVFDDGGVFTLAGDYVLGREPDNAPEVLDGTATPLTLEDPDVTMSRVHAKLLLVGWDVKLVDAGSANGTYTAKPGETEWTRVPSGETVVLKPGTKVSLGGRSLVFDSHHKL
jgi:hypothetical protein